MHNSDSTIHGEFEKDYILLRKWEGRLYKDGEVARLPDIATHHPHYREWLMRKNSATKLCNHLRRKSRSLEILEVGCGNGWLSSCLSDIGGNHVLGIDINTVELEQAKRVFGSKPNLSFRACTIDEMQREARSFDVVVFAASIQYFPSISSTLGKALALLREEGEIHLLDSHFYSLAEVAMARQRTASYYDAAGFPGLASFYFHHTLDEVLEFRHRVLYDPEGLFNRFLRSRNPFHWIQILKE